MATIILICLGIAYLIVGFAVFLFALLNGAVVDAFFALIVAPIIFWPATFIVSAFVFLIMKSKHEMSR